MGFGVEDGELKSRTGDGMNAAAIPGHVSNGGDVSKLKDEIRLFWGTDEPIAAPSLQRSIDIVEGSGFVDGKVGVGAGVGEEDGLSVLDLEWGGSRRGS